MQENCKSANVQSRQTCICGYRFITFAKTQFCHYQTKHLKQLANTDMTSHTTKMRWNSLSLYCLKN